MNPVICFLYRVSSTLSTLLEVLVTFLRTSSVKLAACWKQIRRHCFVYATKFACDTNLVSPESRQVSYKFILQKRLSWVFLPPALYTQDTSNWGKSFLFISPLYTPKSGSRGSIPVHCHKDLAKVLRKLQYMKVTVIIIVIGDLGMVPKDLERCLEELDIRGRIETIQNTTLSRSARILRRVLETWGDLLSLQWNITS